MAENPVLKTTGKFVTYLGVFAQVWLIARKPFAGNLLLYAHGVCILLWTTGLILFRKGLE